MVVLGVNDGCNSSIALIDEGNIVCVLEEERFSRVKMDSGFPKLAIEYFKKNFSQYLSKISYVAVSNTSLDFYSLTTKRYPLFTIEDFLREEEKIWLPSLDAGIEVDPVSQMGEYIDFNLTEYPLQNIKNCNDLEEINLIRKSHISETLDVDTEKVIFVDHHLCHAHHAYFSSPIRNDCLIMTIDGGGDSTNATVHRVGINGKLECLYRSNFFNIGRIYRLITLLLGMKPGEHEYKLMGLSAYAKEHSLLPVLSIFQDTYYIDGLEIKCKVDIKNHYQYFKKKFEGYRFDAIAGGLQRYTEELLTLWMQNWLRETGFSKVTFSGGVALNIKASKCISELPEVSDIFVCLGGGDESLSIGAAQYIYSQYKDSNELKSIKKASISAGFDQKDIEEVLNHSMVQSQYQVTKGFHDEKVANLISEGNVVALVHGNMEFGPRALGNRSILADPRDVSIVRTINEVIKNRDFWMPFTPSIIEERSNDYMKNDKKLLSPFMTLAFDSTELARKEIPAAIHAYDLTLRPQILKKELNAKYYNIIKEFEKITGVGALLNTSLNIHGKPIVHKPIQIINEILSHELVDLKYIVIEDILVSKRGI